MNIFLDRHKFWREVYKFFTYVYLLMRTAVAVAYIWLVPLRRPAC